MADEIKDKKPLDEGYTNWGGTSDRAGSYFTPTGPIGRFFAKFFASPAQAQAVKAMNQGIPTQYGGDTPHHTEVIKDIGDTSPAIGGVSRNPILPQLELNRRRRYKEYEEMDEYPEIGAAFDIYADDSTQRGPRNEKWNIKTESELVVAELTTLFDRIKLDRFLWDVVRNTVKYGDCFTELIVDVNKPDEGIKKIKILNPNYILRVENEFGYLKNFLQEIPKEENFNYGTAYAEDRPLKYVRLDKNQIVHYRLFTSDPIFYPYGKSIAALCHRIFRSLRQMEDAMLIYRLTRAPERRIFYVDTGNLPTSKSEMYIERLKEKFKKEKYYNSKTGTVDARFNPMSMDEDYYVPSKGGKGTKIDVLPGASNLSEIEDVRYYRDKLLAALKVPKDYIVEKSSSPERKANLSQLDVKFARTVHRIQICIEAGIENMAKRHLQLRGFPPSLITKLRVQLPEPSDMSAKRKLDIDEQKTRVIQAVQQLGLFSQEEIYKEYYDMTEEEIRMMKDQIKKDQEDQREQTQLNDAAASLTPQGGGGASPGAPTSPGAPPGAAGGQESAENVPPTATKESTARLSQLEDILVLENKDKHVISRIIQKQKEKVEEVSK